MPQTATWTNWSGGVICHPQRIETPADEDALAAVVHDSRSAGTPVRVYGTGHSFTPICATDGILVSLDGWQGLIEADATRGEATFRAGTKIHQMGAPLLEYGLAMVNMGDIDRQSIAGAVSTGTHGTGRDLGNISSSVVGLRLVLADGSLVDCSADQEPALFEMARVAVGALGVLSRVTLRVLPAYRLHERTWVEPFEAAFARLDEHIAATRHFEFFWSPQDDACAMKSLQPTAEERLTGEPRVPDAIGRTSRYVQPERIGWSYQILPSERNLKFNEMEFAVPAELGPACMREIRELMRTRHADVFWPVEYRTLKSDDIPLSPACGRETVTISIHQAAELSHEAFFADAEAVFRNHRGRPHWGKLHSHTARALRDLYPRWDDFQAVRSRVDPSGRFLNAHLRRLFED